VIPLSFTEIWGSNSDSRMLRGFEKKTAILESKREKTAYVLVKLRKE
jgi:hypothetical protein